MAPATLEWFGTATWRLVIDGVTFWLDAYINRAPTAPKLRLRAEDVDDASYILVGHSHFDHIADAGLMAKKTGAKVVGSALSCEIVRDEGVPASQTIPCTGGEVLDLGPARVHTFRSLHGFNGLIEWPDPRGRDRKQRVDDLRRSDPVGCAAALDHLAQIPEKQRNDGGPLAFVIDWDGGSLFWHDTPGMVRASWEAAAKLEPELALLSAAAAFSTPNVDGEPAEEGAVPFVADMASILRPRAVVMNHHDDWCPPITFHLDEELFRPGIEAAGGNLRITTPGERLTLPLD